MIQLSGLSRLLPTFVSLDAAIAYAEGGNRMQYENEARVFFTAKSENEGLPAYLPQAF